MHIFTVSFFGHRQIEQPFVIENKLEVTSQPTDNELLKLLPKEDTNE